MSLVSIRDVRKSFGPVEALVTMGVLAALARTQPELLAARPAARAW